MKIIGIDLGTTNTYLYGVEKGDAAPAPVTLPRISDENGCIATVVLYQDDKPCLIGNIAESEYHTNRARLASRTLRSQFKPEIAHGGSEAMRWMTDFLHELRAALPDGVLEPDTRVYVGTPSRTREDFGLNLAQCFVRAGWPRPTFVRESDAAMISCLQSGAIDIDDIENEVLILDFGGGTCDVEFEALTGYSVSYLPSGSKPYQQHVTKPMFALPSYLKTQGYQTAAVHCFWAKYWSRDTAYPNLGLDDFISLEDMHGVTKVRKHYWTNGLVTDDSMADQIIGQYEKMKASSDEPVFLHAVTMQNHTNYNKDNYPDDQRVKVLEHPAGMKASTVGALEDFATGIRDADAMLGKLTAYFSQVDEPVILVFWGDHYNPIDSNYDVYTTTGYASDSSADPRLHQTTLLLWSNYSDAQVDLGTLAAYDISPVMMNLYGLQQPLYFQFLNRQFRVASRACTRGVTMNLDGTTTLEPTEFQQRWTQEHWMLQYDLMFGKGYALTRMGLESVAEPAKGK